MTKQEFEQSWDPRDPALEVGRNVVREWEANASDGRGLALSIMIARELRTARERHAGELYNAKAAAFFAGMLATGLVFAFWVLLS